MNLTNLLRETKETKHEMINTIMIGMIGLAAVSFIIYMIYIYTIALEKRIIYTALFSKKKYKKANLVRFKRIYNIYRVRFLLFLAESYS